jgi:hypothetical protein
MADQASPGSVAGVGQEAGAVVQAGPGSGHPAQVFHGRTVSWVAVSIIMAGFLAGGLGLVLGPTWWLFWAGVAAVVVGGLLALGTHIFEDWY